MAKILFRWQKSKNASNLKKHKVAFEEAKSVFLDDLALLVDDPDHSDDEDEQELASFGSDFEKNEGANSRHVIRIISARKATKAESKPYKRK